MYYDEEAVYQDADVLQAEYEAESAAFVAAAKVACQHSSSVTVSASGEIFYPEQVGLVRGQHRCTGDRMESAAFPRGCGMVWTERSDDDVR